MKRSNRLVMLVGIFLAVIAFAGVLLLSQNRQPQTPDPNAPKTEEVVVIALEDIALGAVIEADQIENRTLPIAGVESDAYNDVSQVIGKVARQEVIAGAQVTARTTTGGDQEGVITDLSVPSGMRAMTVAVDQVSGVGTLIRTGDYVDMVVRLKFAPVPNAPIDNAWDTSSKLILQGMQVIGTQLPVVPPAAEGGAEAEPGTGLVERTELVTLALSPSQVEVVKWVQNPELNPGWAIADPSISLVLRSPSDFLDENGNPRLPESPCTTAPQPSPTPAESPAPSGSTPPGPYRGCETTDGIVLTSLIDVYGVLHPALNTADYLDGIGLDTEPSPAP